MKVFPTLETAKAYAASGDYDILPLSTEIMADFITPLAALRILKNVSDHCFLLESAQASDKWGRFTFLGFEPQREITCNNGQYSDGENVRDTDNPAGEIRQLLKKYRSPRISGLPPFTGGLMGYFAYDFVGYSEPKVRRPLTAADPYDFRDIDLMLFDKVIAFDNVRQKIIIIVNMPLTDVEAEYTKAGQELARLVKLLRSGQQAGEPAGHLLGKVQPLFGEDEFCQMVDKAKTHIREGDIFQIVLSNRFSAPFSGSLLNTYRVLRTINPSPYMFYFSGLDVEVAGASPERIRPWRRNY